MKLIESDTHLSTIIASILERGTRPLPYEEPPRPSAEAGQPFHAGTLPTPAYPALLLHSVVLFM